MTSNTKTPVMVLQEFTVSRSLPPPDYHIIFQQSGTHLNRFDFVVSVAGIQARGTGSSKQIGKHQAALNALRILQEMGLYNPSENPVAAFKSEMTINDNDNGTVPISLNCIMELTALCMENKLPAQEFIEISSVGPPHNKEFTYECKVASVTTQAKSSTKKMAKQLAAKEMLNRIRNILPELIHEQDQQQKKITHDINEAVAAFAELDEVIPDKSVIMEELCYTLAKLMAFKGLNYEHFEQDLNEESEESLQKILAELEVGYILEEFQRKPPMAILILKIGTPFTVISIGKTSEEARSKALKDTFTLLNSFMQIKIES
ncbi:hypothetical protein ABEB36_003478 [Hypothenemus hampei]|uniref:DRBM domain-containing protein n=1 Tax=Hypothenemus hampei TaxID=57062 RepID=A0ABD1F9A4_HYPHA|nr:RISC-loading complex subunit tarbp2 protein [Hypothenemus hampei]